MSCLTLCNPKDYSLTGSSAHGIFQARILDWVATPSSRRSSQPRDQTLRWQADYFYCCATWEAHINMLLPFKVNLHPILIK